MLTRYCGNTAVGLDADLPTTYAVIKAVIKKELLEWSEDWELRVLNFKLMSRWDVDSQEAGY